MKKKTIKESILYILRVIIDNTFKFIIGYKLKCIILYILVSAAPNVQKEHCYPDSYPYTQSCVVQKYQNHFKYI
ncbi:hypothetical protein VIAE108258_21860 [Vibrio aerogenes]